MSVNSVGGHKRAASGNIEAFRPPQPPRPPLSPQTQGIVGPESAADPEARLRRLLMMGAAERARALQTPAKPARTPPPR